MSRIYVTITADEIELLENMMNQFHTDNGFKISRQKFMRGLLVAALESNNG
jgi:hypothetical protein